MVECYDELELFKDLLVYEFIRICNYNDYNKLTLLKIVDVIDKCFDKSIETIQDMGFEVVEITETLVSTDHPNENVGEDE